jgi:hypothetical protein
MKKQLSFIAFFVAFLVSSSSFADDTVYQFRLPKYNEPIYGTWINEEYEVKVYEDQKLVYYNWGYAEEYHRVSDKNTSNKFTYTLVEKWEDADGNVWYKELDQTQGGKLWYLIDRISKDGTTLESAMGYSDFPKESDLNPSTAGYRIYHRQ